MLKQVILLASLACLASASFIGHSVLRVVPDTEQQLLAVHKYLESNPSLDVWAEPRRLGLPVDVRVSALQRQVLERFFESQGLQHEVFVEDLDSLIKTQALQVQNGDEPFGWKSYYRLEQIYNWLDELVAGNPTVLSIINVGNSYEGRPMKGLKIKFGENKPIIMLESGIHAREWIGPASATFFINEILSSAADDVVRNYEWHIFPSVNPDGYEYTWTKDRNWRKTRTPHWFFFKGVDANRNWPFHWMESGATRIPWAEIYGGPKAESEVETHNLRAYLDSIAERVHVYLSLHSYSQLLMFPWGYASEHTSTHDKMNAIAGKAAAAIADVHGTEFVYGNIADTIYPASGSSLDYAYSKCVPFPFVFELRDRGRYGFMLPADQIIPAAEETWAGIRVIVQEVFASGVPAKNSC